MDSFLSVEPIDYLIVGHLTKDIIPQGSKLGGTAAYSSLAAKAIGLRVGILTACAKDYKPLELDGIQQVVVPSQHTTTFENIYTPQGRIQHIHNRAERIQASNVPEIWRGTPIVHLGPIADEFDIELLQAFPNSLTCITPQGWMRKWDQDGNVSHKKWNCNPDILEKADAVVLSVEDVNYNETEIEALVELVKVVVVTEGREGARIYWNGDVRRINPPSVEEIDATGAGDIFAASFFIRYQQTRDPWTAAEFATGLAAKSVTRSGMQGIPTPAEVQQYLVEII